MNTQTSGNIVEMTRGPVHEGFADVVDVKPQPIPAVKTRPPEPLNELPAEVRPDNPIAVWLPGYWGWDIASDDFVWVSGVWRVPPPGFQWVPGYWSTADPGFRWIPGFWAAETATEVSYLPEPPEYREEGIDVAEAPSPDYFWVPGYYSYLDTGYSWRPGYWARSVPGWMWIASHYSWTPSGCVFVNGYWDFPLEQRGMLFAPVAFRNPIYEQAGFVYSPRYFIDTGALADNLFVGPGFQSYYFGDYYGNQFSQAGIYPWFAVGTGAYTYDPIFAYRSWNERRRNPRWRDEWRDRYDRLVRDPKARPPHNWRDQEVLARAGGDGGRQSFIARPVQDALRGERGGGRFVRVDDAQRQQLNQVAEARRGLARERFDLERGSAAGSANRVGQAAGNRGARRSLRLPQASTPERRGGRAGGNESNRPNDGAARPAERQSDRNDRVGPQQNPRMNRGTRINEDPLPPGKRIPTGPQPNRGAVPGARLNEDPLPPGKRIPAGPATRSLEEGPQIRNRPNFQQLDRKPAPGGNPRTPGSGTGIDARSRLPNGINPAAPPRTDARMNQPGTQTIPRQRIDRNIPGGVRSPELPRRITPGNSGGGGGTPAGVTPGGQPGMQPNARPMPPNRPPDAVQRGAAPAQRVIPRQVTPPRPVPQRTGKENEKKSG